MRLKQMSTYALYLVIEGEGLTPQNRSHESFIFQHTDIESSVANILQVLLLDEICLVYQFDWRANISFPVRNQGEKSDSRRSWEDSI